MTTMFRKWERIFKESDERPKYKDGMALLCYREARAIYEKLFSNFKGSNLGAQPGRLNSIWANAAITIKSRDSRYKVVDYLISGRK